MTRESRDRERYLAEMACRGPPTPPISCLPSSSSSLSSSSLSSEESSGTGSSSSSRPPSLLERLRAPTPAAIARKRQTKTNPPVGKRQCRGNSVSDPKSVEPSKRVREFPNEQLKVSGGKLVCWLKKEHDTKPHSIKETRE